MNARKYIWEVAAQQDEEITDAIYVRKNQTDNRAGPSTVRPKWGLVLVRIMSELFVDTDLEEKTVKPALVRDWDGNSGYIGQFYLNKKC